MDKDGYSKFLWTLMLRGFILVLSACSSANAVLMASNWARVDSLMSFWSWRMSSMSSFMFSKSLRSCAMSAVVSGRGNVAAMRRNSVKARMMPILTCIAIGERKTLLSIATPFSVKAYGIFLLPPQFWLAGRLVLSKNLEVTNCDIKM